MPETKDNTLNFQASSVEACRICLATDIKLYSLQGTSLGTCVEAVVGFQKSYEGLPNYICYECAPCFVKCHKLIEKSKITQTVLEDIHTKNGQITKPLIEKHNRSELKLQTLDSYLLLNYYYIKYDDDNNTSDFIKTESDPNAQINIKLKNELKEENEEVSDTEILKILTDSLVNEDNNLNESSSDSDVEAIEVDVPVVEIVSDDEKIGDDFISLKSYKVRVDKEPGIKFNKSDRPIYNRTRCLKPKVKKPKPKRKKRNNNEDTPVPDEPYVQRFFNITETPVRASVKKYSCKSCSATFQYPICLATDIKLYSLQGTSLGTCVEAVVGFQKSYEGLPNYICYECAPCFVKCHKLIEKSKITQTVLEDIHTKNGQITKPLIEKHNRSELKLQTLDSYLLLNYYYIKYDDDNNTSDFIKTESDPNAQINIKLKNELKEENEEVSDTEILKILTDSLVNEDNNLNESSSDSDVEAIEVDVPVVEIVSDDEKIGDDFISLKSYKVRVDKEPGIKFNKSDRPIYNRTRCLKPKVKKPKPKRKKRNNNEDTPVPDEPYVQRFFNITETPVRASVKKYSCKSCSATFQYPEEAKDHTFIGCPKLQHSGIAAPNAASSLPEPDAHKPKPKHWETWPGSN
uniref:ZAD domain-containing protein n=1 Tax=Heliothis virescens TaxID=7102 RepID=A0A2A4JZG6_HELVI